MEEENILKNCPEGRQFVSFLNALLTPGIPMSKIMDIRSKLGLLIHSICSKNHKVFIEYITHIMDITEASSNSSIYFIVIFSFAFKYVPFDEK